MNPFDNEAGRFCVLVNHEGQHSLWPTFVAQPDGWVVALADQPRDVCLKFIEENWTDMRPASLVKRMREQQIDPSSD